jgi:hypothetical protein
MDLETAKRLFAEHGLTIVAEADLNNRAGTQLRTAEGPILSIYKSGKCVPGGKRQELLEPILAADDGRAADTGSTAAGAKESLNHCERNAAGKRRETDDYCKENGESTSRPKTTKPATKAINAAGVHKEGSRKGKVHLLFNEQGAEAAWVLGLKLKLKQSTLRSWFAAWKRLQTNPKEELKTSSGTPRAITPDSLAVPSEAANP